MSAQPKPYLTEEDYLEIERKAETKSEYFNGEMFAMAGARFAHNRLAWNLNGLLWRQLRPPCRGCPSDMRVRVSPTGLYTYPDLVVVCGEPQFLDDRQDTLLNPKLIVEVLSPSTEAYDRGRKFEHYRAIDSLDEYLMISSERIRVDSYSKQANGKWVLTSADRLQDSLDLESVNCQLSLSDLYDDVQFI